MPFASFRPNESQGECSHDLRTAVCREFLPLRLLREPFTRGAGDGGDEWI